MYREIEVDGARGCMGVVDVRFRPPTQPSAQQQEGYDL